ncbi:MAG: MFS transporter [Bacteroidetes bacterium]|nr:MFS transporter [Bacteroidota bacterium]MBS1929751.1 MFS transporter [Bacteroidota bacterium]
MYKYKQVFAAACIGMLVFGIMFITLGSILPSLATKFTLDEVKAGTLTSILPIGVVAGSLLFGPIVDRYGYKVLLILTSLLIIPAFEGIAFTESLFILQVCIFVIGWGGGILNGATNALVSDISTGHKGASLSLLGAFFGFGALGMPFLLGALSKHFNYSDILSSVGILFVLVIGFFLITKFPAPKQTQGFPIKEGIKLLKDPGLLLIGLFLFFQSGTEALANNWTTTFLQKGIKIPEQGSLYILTLYIVGLTVARLVLGYVLKIISSFRLMLLSLILSLLGSIILLTAHDYPQSVIAYIILGIGFSAGFPVMLGYAGQLFPNLSGTAFSIVLVIALIGNTIVNYLFGFISHSYGIHLLPWLLLITAVCRIIFLFMLRKKVSLKIKM